MKHKMYELARSVAKNHAILGAYVFLDGTIGLAYRTLRYRGCAIKPDKIVFMTYRNTYECNPKYIAEKIIERELPYDLVWVTPSTWTGRDAGEFPSQIRLVPRESPAAYKEMASARIWVDNSLNFQWRPFPKKAGQTYIETWHGSMGLKRVGKDDVKNARWLKAARRVGPLTDCCISNSVFEDGVYRNTYWPDTQLLEYGHPRNDILLSKNPSRSSEARQRVYDYFGLSQAVRLLLYAPTFRDSGSLDNFDVDFDGLARAMHERFGGDWKILYRLHFHDREHLQHYEGDIVIPATSYPDMQELMVAADAGLTDYSSWCCDYVLTGKPCFIYAKDRGQYDTERGLYIPLASTPFPVAEDNEQLVDNVRRFDEVRYAADCEEFLQERGSYESGEAAGRVVDDIQRIIEGDSV